MKFKPYDPKKAMRRYKKLLKENPYFFYDQNCSLKAFSDYLETNRTYASRFCNEQLGKPFRHLVADIRLEYAVSIMNEPNPPSLTAISASCGFGDLNNFRRIYRAKYGIPPSEAAKETSI